MDQAPAPTLNLRGVKRSSILWALAFGLVACGSDGNFSQFPGFDDWYRNHPPSKLAASDADKALLRRYRPLVWIGPEQEGPIDFYDDYIANGRLLAGDGSEIAQPIDRDDLNSLKDDPLAVFAHRPSGSDAKPTMYGRADRWPMVLPTCRLEVLFLTYHLVFRHSGVAAGIPPWQETLLSLVGDTDDWHQLDHYTAIMLAFDAQAADAQAADVQDADLGPFAVIFQQHNYQRSYLLAQQAAPGILPWPDNDRLEIDVALRSNELYPHRSERTRRPAASFLDRGSLRYLMGNGPKPWRAGDDITDPQKRLDLDVTFLTPSDAFYTFKGWLGQRRSLPGRDGPPGADYKTLPAFMDPTFQLMAFHWHENDRLSLRLLSNLMVDGLPQTVDRRPFAEKFENSRPDLCDSEQ